MISDQELRAALHRLAPDVKEAGVWEALHRKGGRRPTPTALRAGGVTKPAKSAEPAPSRKAPKTRRYVGLAAVAVIALVAVGFGVHALAEHRGRDRDVVVITDDSMSPGSATGTAPAVGSTPDTLPPVQAGDPASHRWASIVQITDNKLMDEVPYLQGDLLAWRGHDGHDYEIVLHDFATGATTQLTDNEVDDWEPKVSGSHVAWMEGPAGGPWTLQLHDLTTGATQEVANGEVNYGQYQLKGALLVWPQIADPTNNVRVLNVSTGEERTIVGWSEPSHRVHARTDGRYVLVAIGTEEGQGDLLLYDAQTAREKTIASGAITDDWRYLDDRRLADGAVVWSASDGHDEEIYLYDIASGKTTQLTHNETSDTEPEVGRGYVLWARSESLQAPGTESGAARDVILYERSSGRERLLGQGFGRLAEDGSLALWSEWPQKAENLWFYDIERDQAAYLGTPGSGASWPDTVDRFVIWYSERLGANEPTAEIMVATVALPSGTTTVSSETTIRTPRIKASSKTIDDVVDEIAAWLNDRDIDGVSVFMPSPIPTGWAIAEDGAHRGGEGGTRNPYIWKSPDASGQGAGYALTFTDGTNRLDLHVDDTGEMSERDWVDSGIASAMGENLLVLSTEEMVVVAIPNDRGIPLYVVGDPDLQEQALALARSVSERARL